VNDLCTKLPDSGLLQQDLRNNVSLTSRGKEFAQWLLERGHKANSFRSDLGSWGDDPGNLFPPGMFPNHGQAEPGVGADPG
jgi:hypothetical protein